MPTQQQDRLIVPPVNTSLASKILAVQAANRIAYWKLDEASGTSAVDSSPTGANGVYTSTFTLDQNGVGDGSRSTLFAGGRVSLATNLGLIDTAIGNKSAGTIFVACQVTNIGVWTDATIRGIFHIGTDANNHIFINKNNTSNQVILSHRAGGTVKTVSSVSLSFVTFFTVCLTWDKAADQVIGYINGIPQSAPLTGLGTYVGTLGSGFSAIADSSSSGSQPYAGWLSHVVLWKVALTPAEVASLFLARI